MKAFENEWIPATIPVHRNFLLWLDRQTFGEYLDRVCFASTDTHG
jgi:hypothetical protein